MAAGWSIAGTEAGASGDDREIHDLIETQENRRNRFRFSYNECMKKKLNPSTPIPTIEELQKRLAMLEKQNAELEAKLQKQNELEVKLTWLEEQLRLPWLKRFGTSSEKDLPGQLSLPLFNEVKQEADPALPEPDVETVTLGACTKRLHGSIESLACQ